MSNMVVLGFYAYDLKNKNNLTLPVNGVQTSVTTDDTQITFYNEYDNIKGSSGYIIAMRN